MTPATKPLDQIDIILLQALQQDATVSHQHLAQLVGLSLTGIHKRIKRLEQHGIIKQTVTLLERERLGLDLMCYLNATFKSNTNPKNMNALRVACAAMPEVLECYTLTGSFDAIIKIIVPDHRALREFMERFAKAQNVIERIQTSIVLEEIKETHELMLSV